MIIRIKDINTSVFPELSGEYDAISDNAGNCYILGNDNCFWYLTQGQYSLANRVRKEENRQPDGYFLIPNNKASFKMEYES